MTPVPRRRIRPGGGRHRTLLVAGLVALATLGACGKGTAGLAGPTWQWDHVTEFAPFAHTEVSDPDRYTLTLASDGSVKVQADCNIVLGTYTTDGNDITLSLKASTRAACPDGSLGDRFVDLLHTVATFSVDGSDLTLRLDEEAGQMGFSVAT